MSTGGGSTDSQVKYRHWIWVGLQPQAEAAAAGSAPEEALQALGTHLAEVSGLGTGGRLKRHWGDEKAPAPPASAADTSRISTVSDQKANG